MLNKKVIRLLDINLTTQTIQVIEREDLFQLLGGIGVGTQVLYERLNTELNGFHEEQPIIFSIGPMETIFPVVTKVAAVFRAPLTGEFGESYAGLRLGMAIRFCGYDAVVITGKAEHPTYLYIDGNKVEFRSAEALWGLDTEETGRLLRDMEDGNGLRSIIRIGRSGEKLIRFAGVNVDTYRHFGRLGLEALFGSKELKGVVFHGNQRVPIHSNTEYNKIYQNIYEKVTETDIMEKYHGIGTAVNVVPLNNMNSLPTRNLQESTFEGAEEISGEAFANDKLIRKLACSGCPIGCIHIGLHRKKYGDPNEYSFSGVSYDHELIFAVGSFLGVKSKDEVLSLIESIERYGLDCITTGVLLDWITEAFQKKLISEDELGGTIEFGDTRGYLQIIDNIINGKNEFYEILSRGTHYAAQRYGGLEFAAVLGKHEMAGYHTGYGNLLGMSVGARHSHLDNGGYSLDQSLKEFNKEKLIEGLINEEIERNVQNCLTICMFARKAYDFKTICSALKSIGIDMDSEKLMELGKRIFVTKIEIKKRLGFDYEKIEFPQRFFETETLHGKLNEDTAKELLKMYADKIKSICQES